MQGLWRPLATYGTIAGALILFPALLAPPDADSVAAFAVAAASIMAVACMPILMGVVPPGRVLKGLGAGGIDLSVTKDHVGWFGARRIEAKHGADQWVLESAGGKSWDVNVWMPNARQPRRSGWKPFAFGQRLANDFYQYGARGQPVPSTQTGGIGARYRWGLATLFLLGGVFVGVLAAWMLAKDPNPALERFWTLTRSLAVAWAAFVAIVFAASLAWKTWHGQSEALGRRAGSAALLCGAGAGCLVTHGTWAATEYMETATIQASLLGASLGFGAIAIGAVAFATPPSGITRILLTLGVAAAAYSAWTMPEPWFVLGHILILALALFQAWVPAAPTKE